MTPAEYHALPRVSSSRIQQVARSWAHFDRAMAGLDDHTETASLAIGTAVHAHLLQPSRVPELIVYAECGTRGAKAYAAAQAAHPDATILLESEAAIVGRAVYAVRTHDLAARMLDCLVEAEHAILWTEGVDLYPANYARSYAGPNCTIVHSVEPYCVVQVVEGAYALPPITDPPPAAIDCKALLDGTWCEPGEDLSVLDIKTTKDAAPGAFAKSAANYGYYYQAAWYLRALARELGDTRPDAVAQYAREGRYRWIAVETSEPYVCEVYRPSVMDIIRADEQIDRWLDRIRNRQPGDFRGYSNGGVTTLSAPSWYWRGGEP